MTWYFDGKPVKTYTDSAHIPHQAMYVILNLAIGGWYPHQLDPNPEELPRNDVGRLRSHLESETVATTPRRANSAACHP